MTISQNDIKLMAAEVLTDDPNGGGRMSGVEVIDGELNQLFNDTSRFDRAYGRVSFRKAFLHVAVENTDTYLGSHSIIPEFPSDPGVHMCLFGTTEHADRLVDAKNRVENYLGESVESRYRLYTDHLQGQAVVNLYCDEGVGPPDVGQVLVLSIEEEGYTPAQQYIRVMDIVSNEIREFENSTCGKFNKRVVAMEISAPLTQDYPGHDPHCFSSVKPPTVVRDTAVSDSAVYYGTGALAQDGHPGDSTITVDDVYHPLVPSANIEVPLVAVPVSPIGTSMIQSGADGVLSLSSDLALAPDNPLTLYLGQSATPGTVQITLPGGVVLIDDGHGILQAQTGQTLPVGLSGTITYTPIGQVRMVSTVQTYSGTKEIVAAPAAPYNHLAYTISWEVTAENAGRVWVTTLEDAPAPATMVVSYLVQGVWYELRENGRGNLLAATGAPGVGTFDYGNNTLSLTLGAIPDVGSRIFVAWGTNVEFVRHDGAQSSATPPAIRWQAPEGVFDIGSVIVTWQVGAIVYAASDDGTGHFSGDGAGEIYNGIGTFELRPDIAIASNGLYHVEYDAGVARLQVLTATPDPQGWVSLSVGDPADLPLLPGSVALALTMERESCGPQTVDVSVTVQDDGLGALFTNTPGLAIDPTSAIDYATGLVSLRLTGTSSLSCATAVAVPGPDGNTQYQPAQYAKNPETTIPDGAQVTAHYQRASDVFSAVATDIPAPAIEIPLLPLVADPVLSGSVRFAWNGKTYSERAGVLVTDHDPTNGAATSVGSFNPSSGVATIDTYGDVTDPSVQVLGLVSQGGEWAVHDVAFRTSAAPLKPGSTQIIGNLAADGSQITGTADQAGLIATGEMDGQVTAKTGVTSVRFGALVADSTLNPEEKLEWWYDPADVDPQGNIWRPAGVIASSLTYNAVYIAYVPIDADVLGLDPVRLPLDGRVLKYRRGSVVVVQRRLFEDLPNPLSPAQQITLAQDDLDFLRLVDQDRTKVLTEYYTADLATGVITMADPLDLSAYTQPLVAESHQDAMRVVREVRINNEIDLSVPLDRDYPAAETVVGSTLYHGDLKGRVSGLWAQRTWTGEWSDELIGDAPDADYNSAQWPIVITNLGALKDRFVFKFTNSNQFVCIGETMGQIGTGTITEDFAPINPATGVPIMTVPWEGWGGGWITGNCLRANFESAAGAMWFVRTTLIGEPTELEDHFTVQMRGDAN